MILAVSTGCCALVLPCGRAMADAAATSAAQLRHRESKQGHSDDSAILVPCAITPLDARALAKLRVSPQE